MVQAYTVGKDGDIPLTNNHILNLIKLQYR